MATYRNNNILRKILSCTIIFALFICNIGLVSPSFAQTALNVASTEAILPLSPQFNPILIKGITPNVDNPLEFNFIIDTGDIDVKGEALESESMKLVKYFLSALTVPQEDLWVNLTPGEEDRIVSEKLGQTDMGRDLLSQDYILKQLSASLFYPKSEIGKKFWDRIYSEVNSKYGSVDIPIDTLSKVWIVPENATVYEHNGSAFVVESHLKVILEDEYLNGNQVNIVKNKLSVQIIKEIIIPEIENQVNVGKSFAKLRQIYNSMILATWYKQKLKESIKVYGRKSLLGEIYVDKNKIKGIDIEDKDIAKKIYNQYLESFRRGAYNYISEEYDSETKEVVPRKYFSGGVVGVKEVRGIADEAMLTGAQKDILPDGNKEFSITVRLAEEKEQKDNAMVGIFGSSKKQDSDDPNRVKITTKDLEEAEDIIRVESPKQVMQLMDSELKKINYTGEMAGIFGNFSNKNLVFDGDIAYMNEIVTSSKVPNIAIYSEGFDEIGIYEHDEFFGVGFAVNEATGELGIFTAPFSKIQDFIIFDKNRVLFVPDNDKLIIDQSWGYLLPKKARDELFDGKVPSQITKEDIKEVVLKSKITRKAQGFSGVEFSKRSDTKIIVLEIPLKFGIISTPKQYRWYKGFFLNSLSNNFAKAGELNLTSTIHTHSRYKIKNLIEDPILSKIVPRHYNENEFLLFNSPGDILKLYAMYDNVAKLSKYYYGDSDKIEATTPYSMVYAHDKERPIGLGTFMMDVLSDEEYDKFEDITIEAEREFRNTTGHYDVDKVKLFLDWISNPKFSVFNNLPIGIRDFAMTSSIVNNMASSLDLYKFSVELLNKNKKVGGIDLNANLLDLDIKIDKNGVPLPLNKQNIDNISNIDGFFPIIINIEMITPLHIPALLGFSANKENSDSSKIT
ncbi:MAG: hypothetical protein P9X22_08095 [Candidatus Zapsychrus exili]|nr:hypothetical protein [Candidatus Zapsychrus exili]